MQQKLITISTSSVENEEHLKSYLDDGWKIINIVGTGAISSLEHKSAMCGGEPMAFFAVVLQKSNADI
jgi:hypothetical protein